MLAKIRGLLLNSDGTRSKGSKGHPEVTSLVWSKILKNEYSVIAINFGTNKEIKLKKSYKYPTILKYIKIDNSYFSLAFLPNIWGDLELTTIFPIRYKNIQSRLRKFDKPLSEISEYNFAFDSKTYEEIKELREDCRSLYAEPLSLFQVEELPRQAVVQKGLSTFHNSFKTNSLADKNLKTLLQDKNYYNKFINKLLSNSTTPQDELKKIMIIVLKKIKVLDPAIGSGAFPMGILHEIIAARVHLGDKTPLSKMKREIIENSIYGIDIEQSAVEIAKLRFWLSIVVDEDRPTPLPNLFYKIMVGNSLLETINGFDPLEITGRNRGNGARIKRMKDKFHHYFNIFNNSKKIALKKEIEQDVDDIFGIALKNYQKELEEIVAKHDLFTTNKKLLKEHEEQVDNIGLIQKILKDYKNHKSTNELFLYKIYFTEVLEEGGFDVVIGNPPYVRQEKIKELKSKKEIQDFVSYNGTADLYIYFFEKGYKLLKENGVLSYITSNKYTRAKYGKDFRKFVLENTSLKEYIDFNGVRVF
ncbi:MAG: Eco57I restriction-modification methylase domain-containing protein, partial [Campylobacterota bacterium]|nr:Eco57I restriction-modification methylase domain-containing protein [Campylobacterota bacterium]